MKSTNMPEELPDFNSIFIPDFDNGKLYWAPGSHFAGKEAGSERNRSGSKGIREKKYCMIQYGDFKNWSRAKILYYMKWGIWVPMIDHKNGDSLDDRIVNLREITPSKNAYNCVYRKQGRQLEQGVSIDKSAHGAKIYVAQYTMLGKKYKKRFSTPEEARQHYVKVMKSYYGKDDSVDYYVNLKQRSPLWFKLRENRWTGSTIIELLKGKTKPPETSDYDNLYMKRGRMLESLAIEAYEVKEYGKSGIVNHAGGVINSKYPTAFYSPDGIDGNILLEVKCLNGEHHEDLVKGNIPPQYVAQIQFGLMITGHKYAKLIAYNPDSSNGLAVILVKRDMRIRNNIKKKLLMVAKKHIK